MVFETGDLVVGWGRLVVDADGVWLDFARSMPLCWPSRDDGRSAHSVRLVGADVVKAPKEFGPDGAIPGCVTITGIWRDDVIEVRDQSPAGPRRRPDPDLTTPPCPPPAGGWPHGPEDENLSPNASPQWTRGLAVAVANFRPSRTQVVLVVATSDTAAAEAVLRPALGDRLCIIRSRSRRQQLDDVRAHLRRHTAEWTIQVTGESVNEAGQPIIVIGPVRVTAAFADWTETLPHDLLQLDPDLLPVADSTTSKTDRDR